MNVGPGLCETCAHSRLVQSARGSEYWLCRLAEVDARFRKYPPLPVLRCGGYSQGGGMKRVPDEGTGGAGPE